jgi:anti-anti-sigma factor
MPIVTDTTILNLPTVLNLQGTLDGDAVTALRDKLAAIVRGQSASVTVDLSDVSFIDGAGVGALAFLFRRLTACGRKLQVIGVSGQPLAFLRDLGLAKTLGLPSAQRARPGTFFGSARAA